MISRLPALAVAALFLLLVPAGHAQTTPPAAAAGADAQAQAKADPAYPFVQQALASLSNHDIPGATTQLAKGLQVNPHSVPAHILLGSLFASKRLFPDAEEQFNLARTDAPTNVAIPFYLADIKLAEGNYDQARAIYVTLEKTPGREDYVAYKVFLCDLMGGQDARAETELAAFKQSPVQPSYYFANAAWCVTQHNSAVAKQFLDKAAATFPIAENASYAQALQTLGFLPLPAN